MNAAAMPARGHWLKALTAALWIGFAAGNLLLWLAMESAALVLSIFLLLLLFATEIGLLARYNRSLAQWRMVGLAWLVYGLARMAADRAATGASTTGTALLMLLALYAMAAGFVTLIVLALRRDVSVIYFVLPLAVMPVLLLSMIRVAGGLLEALWGPALQPGELAPFTWLEPLVMIFSCMIPVGFVTFWGHLARHVAKEQRREPLIRLSPGPTHQEQAGEQ
jgi:hypothetical protein